MIFEGKIPEFEEALPAICYKMENGIPSITQQLRYFKLDCYATDTDNMNNAVSNSALLAETVVEQLNGKDHDIGVMISCTIMDTDYNPEYKEANTPIEIRLIKIGGTNYCIKLQM